MEDQEFNEIKEKLQNYASAIPDPVIEHYMEKCGITTMDPDVKKTISLLTHKFLTDISVGAFQYHKMYNKAAQKDKKFGKEKRITLQVQDLEKTFNDMGIDISKPSYYF